LCLFQKLFRIPKKQLFGCSPVDALVGIHGMWPHARPFCPARRAQSGRERAPRAPCGISALAGLT